MLDYMKSIELLPTDENILDTIYKDPFNRNIEIEKCPSIVVNSFKKASISIFLLMESGDQVKPFSLSNVKWC